jgi:hypothetical protein
MLSRRLFAVLLLLFAGLSVTAPLVAEDTCDEPCGSQCGRCSWCPLVADLSTSSIFVGLIATSVPSTGEPAAQVARPRAFEHVPLPGR